ncbi:flagellar basal body-associated FliL family protein [bacterium]|nr:flagellar basal body-associated FliL family protein [bacterium]
MAEKEKEELEGQQQETEQEEEVKKSAKKLPLIIGGGVLILAILIGGSIFAMKAFSAPADASESETDGEVAEVVEKEAGEYVSTGLYFADFDAFITVLRQSDEYHFTYLKFVPKFELSDAKVTSEILAKLPLIEDKINSVMTDLNWNSIKSERGRERIGEKLTEKLNEFLESGKIIKTYFTTFVAQ